VSPGRLIVSVVDHEQQGVRPRGENLIGDANVRGAGLNLRESSPEFPKARAGRRLIQPPEMVKCLKAELAAASRPHRRVEGSFPRHQQGVAETSSTPAHARNLPMMVIYSVFESMARSGFGSPVYSEAPPWGANRHVNVEVPAAHEHLEVTRGT
jgi:hypothetical protein